MAFAEPEFVAVEREALEEAIRYLQNHANFKRRVQEEHRGADKIQSYADALRVQIPVTVLAVASSKHNTHSTTN